MQHALVLCLFCLASSVALSSGAESRATTQGHWTGWTVDGREVNYNPHQRFREYTHYRAPFDGVPRSYPDEIAERFHTYQPPRFAQAAAELENRVYVSRSRVRARARSRARGILTCKTLDESTVSMTGKITTGVITPNYKQQDGMYAYTSDSYTYAVSPKQTAGVCDIVSQNGLFHLAVMYLTISGSQKPCLVSVTISGTISNAICFDGSFVPPADGCTGATISVGISKTQQQGLILQVGSWYKGLVGNAPSFSTGSFYVDNVGVMTYVLSSGGTPTNLMQGLWDELSIVGCITSQRSFFLKSANLVFEAARPCSKDCTSAPIAFAYNDHPTEAYGYAYTFSTTRTESIEKTTTIENGWSVTSGISFTHSFEAGIETPGAEASSGYSITVSFEATVGSSETEEASTRMETQTTMSINPVLPVPPKLTVTIYERLCTETCIVQSSNGTALLIQEFSGTNSTFVIHSNYRSQQVTETRGIGVDITDLGGATSDEAWKKKVFAGGYN